MLSVTKLLSQDVILDNNISVAKSINELNQNISYLMSKINELSKHHTENLLDLSLQTPPQNMLGRWVNINDSNIYFDVNPNGSLNKIGGLYPGTYIPQYNINGYNIFYKPVQIVQPNFSDPDVLLEFYLINGNLTYRTWTSNCICLNSESYKKM